ncbi:peptidase inhibitor family I36 protein [Kitasatospora sp. NPDC059673]|uniref:peptidase inhibitor family I36 protein n=1 Tax=Kitasatospora sp. NPDC059673 TaxID=3346901 RepID=UPI0036BBACA7
MRTSAIHRAAVTTMLLLAATLPAISSPAHAANEVCPNVGMCFWSETDFQGQFRREGLPMGRCFEFQSNWPDGTRSRTLSLWNQTRFQLEAYKNTDCSGPANAVYPPDTGTGNLSSDLLRFRLAPVCPFNKTCFYQNSDYTGKMWTRAPEYFGRCMDAASPDEVPARSVYNFRGWPIEVFKGDHCIVTYVDVAKWSFRSTGFDAGAFKMLDG